MCSRHLLVREQADMENRQLKPYPIVLTQLSGVRCVVIGGGEVAMRKVRALLESGARVRVISPELHPQLAAWRDEERLVHDARPYRNGDLQGEFLVIAATNLRNVNAAVTAEARQRGLLHNIADDPDGSSFHTLGAVMRGDVMLAVSTGGDSPALAALIRRKLEQTFGPEYGELAGRLGQLRRELGPTLEPSVRTRLWRMLATDHVLELVRAGDTVAVDQYIETLIDELRQV